MRIRWRGRTRLPAARCLARRVNAVSRSSKVIDEGSGARRNARPLLHYPGLRGRVLGLQANTSAKSPEELAGLAHLDEAESSEEFAEAMLSIHRRFGIKILGGCCGTDDRHIRGLAERIRGRAAR